MRARFLLAFALAWAFAACEQPDSIELGQVCKSNAQCKDPADTCMTIEGRGEARCTMACDADNRCPEGYACPVTDPAHKDRGMCLAKDTLGPNIVMAY